MTFNSALTTEISKIPDQVSYTLIEGQLRVKNVESFVVYNLQGMKVADVRQNTSNTMITLKSGVYLVKTISGTFKVLAR